MTKKTSFLFSLFVVLIFVLGLVSLYFGEFLLLYLIDKYSTNLANLPPLMIVESCSRSCGLGNQMFAYAAGLGLSMQNPNYTACVFGLNVVDHLAHAHSAFALHVLPSWRMLPRCPSSISATAFPFLYRGVNFLPEQMDKFDPPHSIYKEFRLEGRRHVLIAGCMQSFKYFQHLPHPFFKLKRRHAARQWLVDNGVASVVVHVRRGDKLTDGSPVVPVAHYEKALRMVGTRRVAVVTDDPAWVWEQEVFRDAVLSSGDDPGFDMALLAEATEAVVIGIGTFGWWGAYLSQAKRKYFYADMYIGTEALGYNESDYIPFGVQDQGEWISIKTQTL